MRRKKINVVVLMGGKSPEHEISLISGREVVKNLDKKKYNAFPVVISRDGNKWKLLSVSRLLALPNPLSLKATKKEIVPYGSNDLQTVDLILQKKVDVVFITMHGPYGEDGTVQGMLELAGLRYTGPGVLASAIGMDKIMFRKVMRSEKIPTPKFGVFRKGDKIDEVVKIVGRPPYFVKPHNQGSSVGASIAKTKKELKRSLSLAFKYNDTAIIDEYLKGLEVTCAVIGNEEPIAFPVIEIHPLKGEFFDYESKYSENGSEEIVPARISKSLTKKVQGLAKKVYKAIGARGFSRIDFILKNNKEPVVLEINTIPGLTPMSLLPKAAKAVGYSYSKFLEKVINLAIST